MLLLYFCIGFAYACLTTRDVARYYHYGWYDTIGSFLTGMAFWPLLVVLTIYYHFKYKK